MKRVEQDNRSDRAIDALWMEKRNKKSGPSFTTWYNSKDTRTFFSLQGVDGEHELDHSTKRNEFGNTERVEVSFCQHEKNFSSDAASQELDYCEAVIFAKGKG